MKGKMLGDIEVDGKIILRSYSFVKTFVVCKMTSVVI